MEGIRVERKGDLKAVAERRVCRRGTGILEEVGGWFVGWWWWWCRCCCRVSSGKELGLLSSSMDLERGG